MQQAAIALSVILGFLSAELFGLHTGGLISAGYLAFYVERPYRLLSTLLMALAIYGAVRLLSRFLIVYGSRRFMLSVLLSLLGAWLLEKGFYYAGAIPQDMRAVGYIVPGLIANDMLRQGVLKTLPLTLLLAFAIRMILMTGGLG